MTKALLNIYTDLQIELKSQKKWLEKFLLEQQIEGCQFPSTIEIKKRKLIDINAQIKYTENQLKLIIIK